MIQTDITTVYLIMRRVKGALYIYPHYAYIHAQDPVLCILFRHLLVYSNASITKCKEYMYRYST